MSPAAIGMSTPGIVWIKGGSFRLQRKRSYRTDEAYRLLLTSLTTKRAVDSFNMRLRGGEGKLAIDLTDEK